MSWLIVGILTFPHSCQRANSPESPEILTFCTKHNSSSL
jgi:hypothetical protein